MRFDVTPLDAASRSVATVARSVVDYLEGAVADPGAGLFTTGEWAHQFTTTATHQRDRAAGPAPVPRFPGSWRAAILRPERG